MNSIQHTNLAHWNAQSNHDSISNSIIVDRPRSERRSSVDSLGSYGSAFAQHGRSFLDDIPEFSKNYSKEDPEMSSFVVVDYEDQTESSIDYDCFGLDGDSRHQVAERCLGDSIASVESTVDQWDGNDDSFVHCWSSYVEFDHRDVDGAHAVLSTGKQVRFGNTTVREYFVTRGALTASESATPLQLDWDYHTEYNVPMVATTSSTTTHKQSVRQLSLRERVRKIKISNELRWNSQSYR